MEFVRAGGELLTDFATREWPANGNLADSHAYVDMVRTTHRGQTNLDVIVKLSLHSTHIGRVLQTIAPSHMYLVKNLGDCDAFSLRSMYTCVGPCLEISEEIVVIYPVISRAFSPCCAGG
jgi:hypothetical protein